MFFCNFLFLLRFCFYNCKCRRYFFPFLSKGLFKRFFLSQTLVFFVVLIKMFLPAFFSCCNFVFYSCTICVTFPLLLQKDFWLIFQPHFHRKLLAFAFLLVCGISLAVHVHCKKSPLVVLGNCRFIYNFFCNSCSIFYNLLSKIKNFHIKNAVTTVFFHGHHGNFISFYIFLYTICFTGRMKYNTSSLLFIVITQLLCWANCIFMASAFITLRQSLRYLAL